MSDEITNPFVTEDGLRNIWLVVELSPFNIRPIIWFTMRNSGMTYIDIARAFGVTKQAVSQEIKIFEDRYLINRDTPV